ncbi:MAG: hypothetical protein P8127_02500 [Acidobacteriota bacterium]
MRDCRTRRSIALLLGILLVAPVAAAGPQLWLFPEDDGPREGGHLVPQGTFVLVVENRAKDSEENIAQGIELVVAVNDPSLVTAITLADHAEITPIEIPEESWTEGTPELPCSGKQMPRHGVYPSTYAKVLLGDLNGGERFEVDVTVEGAEDLRVHFDAMATSWKTTGKGPKCSDVSNPSGHCVTVGQNRGGGGHDECGKVRVSKTAEQKFVDLGDALAFEITVSNEGDCDLTDPVLRDFIPVVEDGEGGFVPAFSVTGEDPPATPVENTLEWYLDSPLAAGEEGSVLLEVLFDQELAAGQRVVNRACVDAGEMSKPRCAAAVVYVGNPYGDDGPAGPGFWCHTARFILEDRPNIRVEAEDFDAWLDEIGESSLIFHVEPFDVSTIETARDLLCTPQSAEGAADRLARHLLTLWLNVVSGRLAMDQEIEKLCDGDELMPEDVEPTTVMALITAVEDALNLPAEDQELNYWTEVVDAVNNSLVPGEPGCSVPMTVTGRRGPAHGKRGGDLTKHKVID